MGWAEREVARELRRGSPGVGLSIVSVLIGPQLVVVGLRLDPNRTDTTTHCVHSFMDAQPVGSASKEAFRWLRQRLALARGWP